MITTITQEMFFDILLPDTELFLNPSPKTFSKTYALASVSGADRTNCGG
jgi:hypothetical protein